MSLLMVWVNEFGACHYLMLIFIYLFLIIYLVGKNM